MLRELFQSLFQNVKQKVANPFLGTFIVIWTLRKWKAIYSVITIDPRLDIDKRIDHVEKLFVPGNLLSDLAITLAITFTVLIVTYLLIDLGKFIAGFNADQLLPWFMKLVGPSRIVTKEKYDKVCFENDRLRANFDRERDERIKKQIEVEDLEKKLGLLLSSINESNKAEKIDKKDINKSVESNDVEILISILSKNNLIIPFLKIVEGVRNGDYMSPKNNDIRKIATYNLIGIATSLSETSNKYKLTPIGEKVADKVLSSIDPSYSY